MIDLLIFVEFQHIINRSISRPQKVVFFTKLKKVKPSRFHRVDDGVVDVRSIRYQEGHVEVLDVSTSRIGLDQILVVPLLLLHIRRIRKERSWRPPLKFRFYELYFRSCCLKHAIWQPTLFSAQEGCTDRVLEDKLVDLVV